MLSTRRALAAAFLLLAFSAAGRTQQQQIPYNQPRQINPTAADPHDPRANDPTIASIEQRQSRARNDERQKRLVADTERLLTLATQLHDDVGKTNKNILSLDVVHRADEIEKLAHSVKERMKG